MQDRVVHVTLSERNLRALLAKLGGSPPNSACTIIYDTREPRAVVEDDAGLGYIIKVGTSIGLNGGQVRAIERGQVLVEEDSVDFYGDRHPSSVVLQLRTSERGTR